MSDAACCYIYYPPILLCHTYRYHHAHRAFRGSSAALLTVMKHELGLMQRLASLKHYFLCDRGDLLLAFVDMAEEELNKRAHEVSTVRLQTMFDLAVRTSSASTDPTSEDLRCLLDHRSLLGMLKHILRVPETMPAGVRRAGERVLPNMRPAGGGGSGGGTPREGAVNAAEQKLLQVTWSACECALTACMRMCIRCALHTIT